ncbi:MAG: hemerythrin-like metal-binding protein [Rhodocyclaceae bacterium]|nr:hemerythrin-like metal-binding protein [Rhodocyclaceae bacterium]
MAEKAFFEWSDAISVGVDAIDEQHKTLIGILNRLFIAIVERTSNEVTIEILDALIDYTKTHFELEEKLMRDAGYNAAEYALHLQQHQAFIAKTSEIARKHLVDGKSISFEVVHFLKRWLQEHILGTDKKYAAVLQKMGLPAPALAAFAEGDRAAKEAAAPKLRKWWQVW